MSEIITESPRYSEEAEKQGVMYRNIVVGYDDSESSRAALMEVASRVKRHGGKVTLVHAVFFDEEEFGIAPVQLEKRFEVGRKICYQAKEKFSAQYGIELESIVCQGGPPEVLADVARGKNADLVALGAHGRGIKRLILGSVTTGVIANSPCDVLVVKRPCTKCNGEYKSILVAYDGSRFSQMALMRAGKLAMAEEADVSVLYVIPRYEEMIGFFKTDSIKKSLMEEAEKVLETARKISKDVGFPMGTLVAEGHAADKVLETAERLKSDLIMMGSHGWTGVDKAIMGGTTERVIVNASCPILVVR